MNKSEESGLVVARRYTRRDERLQIMESLRRSGLSAAQYAEETGIPVRRLYRWGKSAMPAQETSGFIELPPLATGTWAAEVASGAGSVRIAASASPAWAASLIRELNRC